MREKRNKMDTKNEYVCAVHLSIPVKQLSKRVKLHLLQIRIRRALKNYRHYTLKQQDNNNNLE